MWLNASEICVAEGSVGSVFAVTEQTANVGRETKFFDLLPRNECWLAVSSGRQTSRYSTKLVDSNI